MGQGLIVGATGEGRYQVKLIHKPVAALKTRLDDEIQALEQRILDATNTLGQTWRETAVSRLAVDALIEQYRTGEIDDEDADKDPEDPAPTTEWAARVIYLTNENRVAAGLPPVVANALLSAAAREHAEFLTSYDTLSHTGNGGTTPRDRATAQGYAVSGYVGENVAAGQTTPEAVVAAWMNSPPHKANILSTHFAEVGVAVVFDATTTYRFFWVQLFGSV